MKLGLLDESKDVRPPGRFLTKYWAISFNSARVVTCDPKYRFSTSATNKVWRDTSKNLAFKAEIFENSAFFAPLEGDLALMSRILHSALGTVTRDRDRNSSPHRGCVTRDH
jgi:hypothetical protein